MASPHPARRDPWDPEANLVSDLSPDSDSLLIAFSGWLGGMGMNHFDFTRLSDSLHTKRILLRDSSRRFFMMGVPGVGAGVEEIVLRLREMFDRSGASRLVVIGNSMGGFSAILFGVLLGADEIQSFAPRTSYRWHHRILHRGFWRILRVILDLKFRYGGPRSHLDLREFLRTRPEFAGQVHIHYNRGLRLDRVSAERLSEFPNVNLHPHPFERHDVVGPLNENGELRRILNEALHPEG